MSNKRQKALSRSIHRALLRDQDNEADATKYNVLVLLFAFLSIWQIRLVRISAQLFKSLRNEVWDIDEADYIESFVCNKKNAGGDGIQPMGDLGYSGSVMLLLLDNRKTHTIAQLTDFANRRFSKLRIQSF